MKDIDRGEKQERFEEQLRRTRHVQQIQIQTLKLDSQMLQERLDRMRRSLPAGMPPGVPPLPPKPSYDACEHIDADTLRAREKATDYIPSYNRSPARPSSCGSTPPRAKYRVNYEQVSLLQNDHNSECVQEDRECHYRGALSRI